MDYSDKNKRNQKRSRLAAGISLVIAFCTVLGGAALAVSQGISEYPAGSGNPAVSAQDMLSDQLGIGSMIRTLDPDQQEGITLVSREGPSRILGIDDVKTGDDAGAETDGEQAADGAAAQAGSSADAAGAAEASASDAAAGETAAPAEEAAPPRTPFVKKDPSQITSYFSGDGDSAEKPAVDKDSLTKLQKRHITRWEESHWREFPLNAGLNNYNWTYLKYTAEGRVTYKGDKRYTIRHGIDVSEFQGSIDWDKVREDGFDFAFIRAGHRFMHTGDLQQDRQAVKNLKNAEKAGFDIGVYVFSQAVSKKEAREEAQLCLDVIEKSGVEITLPVVYDPEIVIEDYAARINYISGEQFTDNCVAFCKVIEKAGYTPAVYANSSTQTDILDMSRLEGAVIWYADYTGLPDSPYRFTFWQYSDYGWVSGIPETETDLNVWFIENTEDK